MDIDHGFASRSTFLTNFSSTGAAGAKVVANGEPIRVWGISSLALLTTPRIVAESADGSKVYAEFQVNATTQRFISIPFYADAGLRIRVEGTAILNNVTIFHDSPGS